tara:strand:+ start:3284 stop:4492 length:1209 start_codon:yes stop_codon:yes gene_type:complete
MEQQTKQEGEFSLKGKNTKPKQLNKETPSITKVDFKEPLLEEQAEKTTKVTIPNDALKSNSEKAEDPIEEEPTLITETTDIKTEEISSEEEAVNNIDTEFTPLKEITDEDIEKVTKEAQEAVRDEKVLGRKLPENVEKLVSFMEDTGGTVEDYVRLNADYSSVDEGVLLKEYYKKTKPYLDSEDLDIILEDYDYDEDIDDERDIRKKKIAFKEEVAKAKNFLESTKSKYYDEIKLRPGVTQEQKKATDFFNRFNEDQKAAEKQHLDFKSDTNKYFSDEFKGFDFDVSGKKFRYGVQDSSKVASDQSNINNFVGKFLNKDGVMTDTKGYHKALYMASNGDSIINHFYEQGKADAVRDVVNKSKNQKDNPRASKGISDFVNGIKVKSISSPDSSRLSIKKNKFK